MEFSLDVEPMTIVEIENITRGLSAQLDVDRPAALRMNKISFAGGVVALALLLFGGAASFDAKGMDIPALEGFGPCIVILGVLAAIITALAYRKADRLIEAVTVGERKIYSLTCMGPDVRCEDIKTWCETNEGIRRYVTKVYALSRTLTNFEFCRIQDIAEEVQYVERVSKADEARLWLETLAVAK